MDLKSMALTALGWIAGAFFLALTTSTVLAGGGASVVLIGLLLIALVLPPARKLLHDRTGLSVRGAPLVVAIVALISFQVSLAGSGASERAEREEEAKRKASIERVAKVRAETLAYFEQNKAAVLLDVQNKVQAGQLTEATSTVSKYAAVSKDPDLARLKRVIEAEDARAQLKAGEEAIPLEKRAALYKTLAEYEPSNAQYAAKAKETATKLEKVLAAEREAKAAAERIAQRKKSIESQFSGWDGAHRNVERQIKRTMKNPDSYEHVETRYRDMGNKLIVTTTIRGTNSFNAVVPNTFIAEVDDNGNVLTLNTLR